VIIGYRGAKKASKSARDAAEEAMPKQRKNIFMAEDLHVATENEKKCHTAKYLARPISIGLFVVL